METIGRPSISTCVFVSFRRESGKCISNAETTSSGKRIAASSAFPKERGGEKACSALRGVRSDVLVHFPRFSRIFLPSSLEHLRQPDIDCISTWSRSYENLQFRSIKTGPERTRLRLYGTVQLRLYRERLKFTRGIFQSVVTRKIVAPWQDS